MTLSTALNLRCAALDGSDSRLGRDVDGVLGLAAFGGAAVTLPGMIPLAAIGAAVLAGSPAIEVWRSSAALRSGRHGPVEYRSGGGVVFGTVSRPEQSIYGNAALQEAVAAMYAQLFGCLQQLGLTRVLRIWNFLPDINRNADGVERYRCFNEARQRAFQCAAREVRVDVPAASAVGLPAVEPLSVYFLACDSGGTAIENPRQVAAYDYPPEYGAYSPTFARGMLAPAHCGGLLFISGTASIVGHRTVHDGDVEAQTREAVANLQAVIGEANRRTHDACYALARTHCKVYVRRPADHPRIATVLAANMEPQLPVMYLQADICRADLLVEIEAVAFPAAEPA